MGDSVTFSNAIVSSLSRFNLIVFFIGDGISFMDYVCNRKSFLSYDIVSDYYFFLSILIYW